MTLRPFLLSAVLLVAWPLTGCDQAGPETSSTTASIEPQECDWASGEDCGPVYGGGSNGNNNGNNNGGTTVVMGTCPSRWNNNDRISPSGEDMYEEVEFDQLLVGNSTDSSVHGKSYRARLVSSNNAYSHWGSPRANGMTQVQVLCGSTWKTPDEDDFRSARVKVRVRFINDVPQSRWQWDTNGGSYFSTIDETLTSLQDGSSDLHVKEGGDRLDTTDVLESVHSVSVNGGATYITKSRLRGDIANDVPNCLNLDRYFVERNGPYRPRHILHCSAPTASAR